MKTKDLCVFTIFLVYWFLSGLIPLAFIGEITQFVILSMFFPILSWKYRKYAISYNLFYLVRTLYIMYPVFKESMDIAFILDKEIQDNFYGEFMKNHPGIFYLFMMSFSILIMFWSIYRKLKQMGYYERLKGLNLGSNRGS